MGWSKRAKDKVSEAEATQSKKEEWFTLIHKGDLDAFHDRIQEDPAVLHAVDPTGATPLHLLLLHDIRGSKQMAKEIMTEHPELCKVQYTGDQYRGEVLARPCPCLCRSLLPSIRQCVVVVVVVVCHVGLVVG